MNSKFDKPYLEKMNYDQQKIAELFNYASQLDIEGLRRHTLVSKIPLNAINNNKENIIHTIIQAQVIDSNNTENKKLNIIKYVLTKGVSPDLANNQGITQLHLACEKQYSKIIQFLLQYGSYPNSKDQFGRTPMHYLLSGLIKEWVNKKNKPLYIPKKSDEEILTVGNTDTDTDKDKDKYEIIEKYNTDTDNIELYFSNDYTSDQITEKLYEIKYTDKSIDYLIAKGGNPFLVDNLGQSPVNILATNYFIKPFEILKKFGIDLKSKDEMGFSYIEHINKEIEYHHQFYDKTQSTFSKQIEGFVSPLHDIINISLENSPVIGFNNLKYTKLALQLVVYNIFYSKLPKISNSDSDNMSLGTLEQYNDFIKKENTIDIIYNSKEDEEYFKSEKILTNDSVKKIYKILESVTQKVLSKQIMNLLKILISHDLEHNCNVSGSDIDNNVNFILETKTETEDNLSKIIPNEYLPKLLKNQIGMYKNEFDKENVEEYNVADFVKDLKDKIQQLQELEQLEEQLEEQIEKQETALALAPASELEQLTQQLEQLTQQLELTLELKLISKLQAIPDAQLLPPLKQKAKVQALQALKALQIQQLVLQEQLLKAKSEAQQLVPLLTLQKELLLAASDLLNQLEQLLLQPLAQPLQAISDAQLQELQALLEKLQALLQALLQGQVQAQQLPQALEQLLQALEQLLQALLIEKKIILEQLKYILPQSLPDYKNSKLISDIIPDFLQNYLELYLPQMMINMRCIAENVLKWRINYNKLNKLKKIKN